MECPKCHHSNPDDTSFCEKCGGPLLTPNSDEISPPQTDDKDHIHTKTIKAPIEDLVRIDKFADRYEIIEELGRGGMGVVYKAKDTKLKRTVALKFLPPELTEDSEAKQRFMREAQAAAALDHPHICTVYEVDHAEEKIFISMAYIEGHTLKKKIKSESFSLNEALDIALQIAEGLDEAHRKGIVHRDIKSANIMLGRKNQAKIMDFGLARLSGKTRVTKTGTTMGTIAYMSPEQAKGESVDYRSDIFSFGVVLYELITGQLPFEGENDVSVLHSLLYKKPEPLKKNLPDIPEQCQWIIDKALSKDISRRYQNTEELIADLKSLRAGGVGETEVQPIKRIKRKGLSTITAGVTKAWRRATWAQRLGTGIVLVLLSITAIIFWPTSQGIVPAAEAASLVALPAQVYGEAEDNYLTDALPGTLSTMLSEVEWLDTKVPPSSLEVEQVKGDLVKIGEAYGVNMCVVSSVTPEMNNLVLNVQLVDPRTRDVLWGKVYRGARTNYIDIVREAAKGILTALRPEASPVISGVRLTISSEAELSFRRGQYHSNRFNNLGQTDDFDKSLAAFEQTLKLDPNLADAAAEIAMLYQLKTEKGTPPQEMLPEIDAWARRALKIDQGCSRAWIALQFIEIHQPIPSWNKLLENGLKATSLGQEDPMTHLSLSFGLSYSGAFSLALEAVLEARRLDPLYLHPATEASEILNLLGRNEEALTTIDEILRIEPDMPHGLFLKSVYLVNMNRMDEAADILKRLEKSVAERSFPPEYFAIAQLVYNLNHEDKGLAKMALDGLLQTVNDPRIPNLTLRYLVGLSFPILITNEYTDTILQIVNTIMKAGVVIPYDFFLFHPRGKDYFEDSRFEDILVASKTQFIEILTILEDTKSRGELPAYLEKPLADLLDDLGIESDQNRQF